MVLRDRLIVVDVWFGFQADGKLSFKMPNWPQFGAVKRFEKIEVVRRFSMVTESRS